MITWFSKQQQTVLTTTSEAEYTVISYGARKRVWVRRLLNEILLEQAVRKMEILGNNKTSFTLTKDLESQNCTKQINIIYHHV